MTKQDFCLFAIYMHILKSPAGLVLSEFVADYQSIICKMDLLFFYGNGNYTFNFRESFAAQWFA
jgi:hypothetical protein